MSRLKLCLNAQPIMSPELLGKLKTNQSYAGTAINSARSWTVGIIRLVVAHATYLVMYFMYMIGKFGVWCI
jgi:hypothetical protein